jgi:hypothetical protein
MLRARGWLHHRPGNRQASVTERPTHALAGEAMSAMLESLSEQIRKCYEQAEECARKAAAQIDPALKQDFFRYGATLALFGEKFRV